MKADPRASRIAAGAVFSAAMRLRVESWRSRSFSIRAATAKEKEAQLLDAFRRSLGQKELGVGRA